MDTDQTALLAVRRVDYRDAHDSRALVALLDGYAQDPMGGGQALSADVHQRLCDDLARLPHAASFIAWLGDEPVGLINTFEAYSTFKARPLVNVHDVAVAPGHRGRGVGQALLAAAEAHARERGACKLTLEVLTGNQRALRSYEQFGFAPYRLDPREGQAQLMQKWL
ncbi:MAG: GNAT family N-acetyltransferase [Ottowia sp.]|nr:GNAT family N-acetyltransferase [Ottowia sp.]